MSGFDKWHLVLAILLVITIIIIFVLAGTGSWNKEYMRTPWKKGPERFNNPYDQLTPAGSALYNRAMRRNPAVSEYLRNKQEPPALINALFS